MHAVFPRAVICAILTLFSATARAFAEMQCAPAGVTPALPTTDPLFAAETAAWLMVTRSRYLEGDGNCSDVSVPGYEDFPTMRCSYASLDAGKRPFFQPLPAEVIVLNPSSEQLAAWGIHACRINDAADMSKCLVSLRDHVKRQNGAQFPVAGSVVESKCSTMEAGCDGLPDDSVLRAPRHTWFRDGVSVDYVAAQGINWLPRVYPDEVFEAALDVAKSDLNLNKTYYFARVAGIKAPAWIRWRTHVGLSVMPEGETGTIDNHGWRKVSAAVHKAACSGASNELFDAAVFANRAWTVP